MKKIESCSPNCVRVYKQKKSESLSTLAFGRYSCGGKIGRKCINFPTLPIFEK